MNPSLKIFYIVLALVYIGCGIFIALGSGILQTPWQYILGVLFVAYGIFRLYRAFQL